MKSKVTIVVTILSLIFLHAKISEAKANTSPSITISNELIRLAQQKGVPLQALNRAFNELQSPQITKKNVFGLFDISQPGNQKRFYVIDVTNSQIDAYHMSHGKGNGDHAKATRFRGFNQKNSNMTPLGVLKTGANTYFLPDYTNVVDPLTQKKYSNLTVLDIEGIKPYNNKFNPQDLWAVFHSKWYATQGYRTLNKGHLGRSLGCLVVDPEHSNEVFQRLAGGAMVYIAVGNEPLEKYLY